MQVYTLSSLYNKWKGRVWKGVTKGNCVGHYNAHVGRDRNENKEVLTG